MNEKTSSKLRLEKKPASGGAGGVGALQRLAARQKSAERLGAIARLEKSNKSLQCVKRTELLMERLSSLAAHCGPPKPRMVSSKVASATTPSLAKRPPRAAALTITERQAVGQTSGSSRPFRHLRSESHSFRREFGGAAATWLSMNQDATMGGPSETPADLPNGDAAKSVSPLAPLEQVTEAQITRYARVIYEKTGIRVSPQKKMLLSNRLRRRLRQTGISNFEAYYRYLKDLPPDHAEWDDFFQEITTHETYMFRDENQWDWFRNEFLPLYAEAARDHREPRRLRVWSAACSTGDEVYTIACCIAASLPGPASWEIDILGTDIAVGEIRRAEQPVFGQRAMRLVPEECREFFQKSEDSESWTPKPALRRMVRFHPHNLMNRLKERPFDVVFLKNVLIYFDKESKRRVLENVGPLVRPGGMLVAGAAEGVTNLVDDFQRIEPWLFRRNGK